MPKSKKLNKRLIWGLGIAVLVVVLAWGAYASNVANMQGRFGRWADRLSGTDIERMASPMSGIEIDWKKNH